MKPCAYSHLACWAALCLVLSACGGGTGSPGTSPSQISTESPAVGTPNTDADKKDATTTTATVSTAPSTMVFSSADALPASLETGTTYTVGIRVNNTTDAALQLVMDWGTGQALEQRSVPKGQHDLTLTSTFMGTTGNVDWKAQLLGAANTDSASVDEGGQATVLAELAGSVDVLPKAVAPTLAGTTTVVNLSFASGGAVTHALVFDAADANEDLSQVRLSWSTSGAATVPATVIEKISGGAEQVSFATSFNQAGTFTWMATAKDKGDHSSAALTGQVVVAQAIVVTPPAAPTLSLSNTQTYSTSTATPYTLSFNAADVDGDLSQLTFRWTDEPAGKTFDLAGKASAVQVTRTFDVIQKTSFYWEATAKDAGGRSSTKQSGTVTVEPVVVSLTDDFPLPAAKTNDNVQLLGQECASAQNGFFPMPAADDVHVGKRRRYVFDQFLVAKADKTGYEPKATFDKWVKYEVDTKKKLYEYFHSFGLVALMFHQGKLSTGQTQTDWYNYANQIARKSVGNVQYEPFQRYQMMDTYMRWRCVMEDSTKTAIKNHMVARPFNGNYGTANLKILNAYTRYMSGLAWGEGSGVLRNMSAADPTGYKMLMREAGDAYKYTSGEWASQPYDGYNTFVYLSLAQLSPDPALATMAHLGFQAAMAKTASVWMKGILATYSLRDYPPFKTGPGGAYASHWFYLGGKIPAFTLSRAYLVGAAVNYALPPEILAIATDRTQPLNTPLMLYAGTSKVHSHSYIEKDFGVFSVRSATRDGTGSTFTPGQTTPPGVVWSPKFGRSNFWLTITEDDKLTEAGKGWTNTTTNLVMTKRGQQWLQHKGTLLMVTDNREGQIPESKPILHQIVGSMPDVHSSSTALNAIDTACAQTACTQSTDGKSVYQLFYARDGKVMIALSSSRPFTMYGAKRFVKDGNDWLNPSSFRIPLNFSEQLAAGVAIETADYANTAGTDAAAKLKTWKDGIIQKSKFRFVPPSSDKERATLYYTDRLGNTLHKEYIWQGNAPYWRTKGWASSSNPDPTPHETINGVPVNHTVWPAADNRLVHQATVGLVPCPLYVKKTDGPWLKIWDNTSPPFTANTACKAPG